MTPNLIKQSPVAVLTSAEAAGAALLAFLVAHGLISADLAKSAGPYFVLLYVAAFGVAKWWNVMPWSKGKTLAEQLEDGRLPDADMARIEAALHDALSMFTSVPAYPTVLTGADHPDTEAVGEPADQVRDADTDPAGPDDAASGLGGMSAGAS